MSGLDDPEGDFLQDICTSNSLTRQNMLLSRVQNSFSLSFNFLSLI